MVEIIYRCLADDAVTREPPGTGARPRPAGGTIDPTVTRIMDGQRSLPHAGRDASNEPIGAAANLATESLLAFDDVESRRYIVSSRLRRAGYDVTEAATGAEVPAQV